jgi:hypothetical protein
VIVATSEELHRVVKKTMDPLGGPISADNEEQALATLQAALLSMLEPLQQLPLLGPAPGAAAAAGGREEQLLQLSLEQPAPSGAAEALALSEQEEQHQRQQQECNENGFDAGWQMSRHFCRVYLEGQLHILRRSLQECRGLMQS